MTSEMDDNLDALSAITFVFGGVAVLVILITHLPLIPFISTVLLVCGFCVATAHLSRCRNCRDRYAPKLPKGIKDAVKFQQNRLDELTQPFLLMGFELSMAREYAKKKLALEAKKGLEDSMDAEKEFVRIGVSN